jgi:hypothetical protein
MTNYKMSEIEVIIIIIIIIIIIFFLDQIVFG